MTVQRQLAELRAEQGSRQAAAGHQLQRLQRLQTEAATQEGLASVKQAEAEAAAQAQMAADQEAAQARLIGPVCMRRRGGYPMLMYGDAACVALLYEHGQQKGIVCSAIQSCCKQAGSVTALPRCLCSALCENLQVEAQLVDLQKTHQHLLQQAASMAAAVQSQLTDSQAAMSGASQAGGATPPHATLWPHEAATAGFGHQGSFTSALHCHRLPALT